VWFFGGSAGFLLWVARARSDPRPQSVDLLEGLHSVHAGHPDIHQGQVEGCLLSQFDCLLSIVGDSGCVALPVQDEAEGLAQALVVVHDEDAAPLNYPYLPPLDRTANIPILQFYSSFIINLSKFYNNFIVFVLCVYVSNFRW